MHAIFLQQASAAGQTASFLTSIMH